MLGFVPAHADDVAVQVEVRLFEPRHVGAVELRAEVMCVCEKVRMCVLVSFS